MATQSFTKHFVLSEAAANRLADGLAKDSPKKLEFERHFTRKELERGVKLSKKLSSRFKTT